MGNLQVRFLEGWAPEMAPGYSTVVARIGSAEITSGFPVTRAECQLCQGALDFITSASVWKTTTRAESAWLTHVGWTSFNCRFPMCHFENATAYGFKPVAKGLPAMGVSAPVIVSIV